MPIPTGKPRGWFDLPFPRTSNEPFCRVVNTLLLPVVLAPIVAFLVLWAKRGGPRSLESFLFACLFLVLWDGSWLGVMWLVARRALHLHRFAVDRDRAVVILERRATWLLLPRRLELPVGDLEEISIRTIGDIVERLRIRFRFRGGRRIAALVDFDIPDVMLFLWFFGLGLSALCIAMGLDPPRGESGHAMLLLGAVFALPVAWGLCSTCRDAVPRECVVDADARRIVVTRLKRQVEMPFAEVEQVMVDDVARDGVHYGEVVVVARSGARMVLAESAILGVAKRPWQGILALGIEVARLIGVPCRTA